MVWAGHKLGIFRKAWGYLSGAGEETKEPVIADPGGTVIPKSTEVKSVVQTPTATPSPTPTAKPTEQIPTTRDYWVGEGVTLIVDSEGVPIEYSILGSGFGSNLQKLDRAEVLAAREKARVSGEPEVFNVILWSTESGPQEFVPTDERPKTKTLPTDTLTEDELAERGITIIQGDETKLHIRTGAFVEGELLDTFDPNGEQKLKIVLVDGPAVLGNFLGAEKYDGVRDLVGAVSPEDIQQFRERMAQMAVDSLNAARSELPTTKEADLSSQWDYMLLMKHLVHNYLEGLSDEEIMSRMPIPGKAVSAAGYYTADDEGRVVFVSVGKLKRNTASLILAFLPTGEWVTSYMYPESNRDNEPKGSQTHPDPNDYFGMEEGDLCKEKESGDYLVGGITPGATTRHELVHDWRMSAHWDKFSSSEERFSECETEEQMLRSLQAAHDKWVASGYIDDSGYYLVFELDDGSYILTNNMILDKKPITSVS